MADALKQAINGRIDLYRVLDVKFDDYRDRVDESALRELKRKYRLLSLKYHPDKNPEDDDAIGKFHLLSLAASVLVDEGLKGEYDSWVSRYLYPDGHIPQEDRTRREELIQELNHREASIGNEQDISGDLGKIQAYGEKLRRLKHYEMGYGDWIHLDEHIHNQKNKQVLQPKDLELRTLRIVLDYYTIPDISNLKDVKSWFEDRYTQFAPQFEDIYFSENNSYEEPDEVVVYIVLHSVQISSKLYHLMLRNPNESILDIQPNIPPKAFETFKERISLKQNVLDQFNNEPTVISLD